MAYRGISGLIVHWVNAYQCIKSVYCAYFQREDTLQADTPSNAESSETELGFDPQEGS